MPNPAKSHILFIYQGRSSFVKKDIEILSAAYRVDELMFYPYPKWKTIIKFVQQFFSLLFGLHKYNLVIAQFAGYHTLLPAIFCKIYGKPFLIICGGTESAKFESIPYGNFAKKYLGLVTKWSVQLATHLAPKHQSLIQCNYNYDVSGYPQQGLQYLIKNFKTPYTVIENGYNAHQFNCIATKQSNTFITVAAGLEIENTIPLKGIDLIIAAAPLFAHCTFYIVGVPEGFVLSQLPNNIKCLPSMPNDALIKHYSAATFYLQLSLSEGFPNAICEAMLCECIPIGSAVNAIPDIIADTGYVLYKRDVNALAEIIQQALKEASPTKGRQARHRIEQNFSAAHRSKKLLALVQQLTHQ